MFKTKYKINNHNQLIDLNGDSINFELTFDIQSNPNEKFEILVVDQNTLDTNENFIKTEEYKKSVNGNIQGSVKFDINKYQNFFIIIKSENEVDVEITINKKEIEPQTYQPQTQYQSQTYQQQTYQPQTYQPQTYQPQTYQPQTQYQPQYQPQTQYQTEYQTQYQTEYQTEYQNQPQTQYQTEYQNKTQNQTESQQFDINKFEEENNEKKELIQHNKDSINWNLYIFLFIICLISGSIYIYLNKKKK